MNNDKNQYDKDIIAAMAERIIKKLWVIILILIVYCGVLSYLYFDLLSSIETTEITQEVTQEADSGINRFIGGDYYGTPESENDG